MAKVVVLALAALCSTASAFVAPTNGPVAVAPSRTTALRPALVEPTTRRLATVMKEPPPQEESLAKELARRAAELRAEAAALETSMAAERQASVDRDLDAFFKEADANADGKVTLDELRAALRQRFVEDAATPRASRKAEAMLGDTKNVADVFDALDANADGALERDEFVSIEAFRERLEDRFRESEKVSAVEEKATKAAKYEMVLRQRLDQFEAIANSTDAKARAVAALAYLLPALDALPFAGVPGVPGTAGTGHPVVDALLAGAVSATVLFRALPFSGVFALLALNGLANDPTASRLARFAARHAVVLDLVAVVLLPLGALVAPTPLPGTALEAVVLVSALLAVLNGSNADFFPGSGRFAKKLVDDFDAAVMKGIEAATAAESSLEITERLEDWLRKKLEEASSPSSEEDDADTKQ